MDTPIKKNIASKLGRKSIDENTPLTPLEQRFITNYMRTGNITDSVQALPGYEHKNRSVCSATGMKWMQRANIHAEFMRAMEELKKETVATADEVMTYFTSVMRGEVKDQFGLDAPLSERTKAAQELAKRTVYIENRKSGEPDQLVAIKLDWSRN